MISRGCVAVGQQARRQLVRDALAPRRTSGQKHGSRIATFTTRAPGGGRCPRRGPPSRRPRAGRGARGARDGRGGRPRTAASAHGSASAARAGRRRRQRRGRPAPARAPRASAAGTRPAPSSARRDGWRRTPRRGRPRREAARRARRQRAHGVVEHEVGRGRDLRPRALAARATRSAAAAASSGAASSSPSSASSSERGQTQPARGANGSPAATRRVSCSGAWSPRSSSGSGSSPPAITAPGAPRRWSSARSIQSSAGRVSSSANATSGRARRAPAGGCAAEAARPGAVDDARRAPRHQRMAGRRPGPGGPARPPRSTSRRAGSPAWSSSALRSQRRRSGRAPATTTTAISGIRCVALAMRVPSWRLRCYFRCDGRASLARSGAGRRAAEPRGDGGGPGDGLAHDRPRRAHAARAHGARHGDQRRSSSSPCRRLGLLRGFIVAAFLTTTDYGIWGILHRRPGDAVVAQAGGDQRQVHPAGRARTRRTRSTRRSRWSSIFSAGVLRPARGASCPLLALVYGQPELLAPGLVMALIVPGLRAPGRRSGSSTAAWTSCASGCSSRSSPSPRSSSRSRWRWRAPGYWSLVIGAVAGGCCGARRRAARLALQAARCATTAARPREYLHFSWPLFAGRRAAWSSPRARVPGRQRRRRPGGRRRDRPGRDDRASSPTASTRSSPAPCTRRSARVRDRAELLYESFVKSNRLALMWGMPFGVGVAAVRPRPDRLRDRRALALGRGADRRSSGWPPPSTRSASTGTPTSARSDRPGRSPWSTACPPSSSCAVAAPLHHRPRPRRVRDRNGGGDRGQRHLARLVPQPPVRRVRHGAPRRARGPSQPPGGRRGARRCARSRASTAAWSWRSVELVLYLAVTAAATYVFERPLLREALGYLRRGEPARVPVAG